MIAKSGLEPFKKYYDVGDSRKDEFSVIDLGINQDVHVKPDSKLLSWIPAGMISFNIGNNSYSGGDNNSNFGMAFFLPGSTLKVDGKVLVENGDLK